MAILPHKVSAEIGGVVYEFHPLEIRDYFEFGHFMRERLKPLVPMFPDIQKRINNILPFTDEYKKESGEFENVVYRAFLQLKKKQSYLELFPIVLDYYVDFLDQMKDANGTRDEVPSDDKKKD